MSLSELAAVDPDTFDIVSADVFDTLLLRDGSSQNSRFAEISRQVRRDLKTKKAPEIPPISTSALIALRRTAHKLSYRAAGAERPLGDVRLADTHRMQSKLLSGGDGLKDMLYEADLAVDRRRLTPNLPLLKLLQRLADAGKRVIVVSDTYYSAADLRRLFAEVIGKHPIAAFYSSSDLGLTKHSGSIFAEVARTEGAEPPRILHFGDDPRADLEQPKKAGCQAVLLPRSGPTPMVRKASAALFFMRHSALAG